jgi:acetyl-CoA carboxylase biotin carboxyl carrier protein
MMASLNALTILEKNHHRILSPAVGIFYSFPTKGTFLTAGSSIGKLRVFNTVYDLVLPENVFGEVVFDGEPDKVIQVEYGQQIFHLNPEKGLTNLGEKVVETKSTGGESLEDGHQITAFTTGIFYSKPSPDAAPYVKEGETIEKGKVLGLIEVMKTFNQIIFHGIDSSGTGKIKKILVKDSQEVKLNQPLFLIESRK